MKFVFVMSYPARINISKTSCQIRFQGTLLEIRYKNGGLYGLVICVNRNGFQANRKNLQWWCRYFASFKSRIFTLDHLPIFT